MAQNQPNNALGLASAAHPGAMLSDNSMEFQMHKPTFLQSDIKRRSILNEQANAESINQEMPQNGESSSKVNNPVENAKLQ